MRTLNLTLLSLLLTACGPAGADISDPNDTSTEDTGEADADTDADSDADTDADSDADSDCEPSGTLGTSPEVDYPDMFIDVSERGVVHNIVDFMDPDDDIQTIVVRSYTEDGQAYNHRTYSVYDPAVDWTWDNCTHLGTLNLRWEYDPCTAGLDQEQTPGLQITFGLHAVDSTGGASSNTAVENYTVPGCN